MIITQGDQGSPLTKYLSLNGEKNNYIIGITFNEFVDKEKTLIRFMRTSFAYKNIEGMVKMLEAKAAAEVEADDSAYCERFYRNQSNKRRKVL